MRRFEPCLEYIGSGEYLPDMQQCDDGEYVLLEDVVCTLDRADYDNLVRDAMAWRKMKMESHQ